MAGKIADIGSDAVGLDWTTDIGDARRRVGARVALQGNFDPNALFANPAAIEAEAARILAAYGHGSGHVFNLGHGISQFTPPEHAGCWWRRCIVCRGSITPPKDSRSHTALVGWARRIMSRHPAARQRQQRHVHAVLRRY